MPVNFEVGRKLPTATIAAIAATALALPANGESYNNQKPTKADEQNVSLSEIALLSSEVKQDNKMIFLPLKAKIKEYKKYQSTHLTAAQYANKIITPQVLARWEMPGICETHNELHREAGIYSGVFNIQNVNWTNFGGADFAPKAGEATRKEQIVVAERIQYYKGLGLTFHSVKFEPNRTFTITKNDPDEIIARAAINDDLAPDQDGCTDW